MIFLKSQGITGLIKHDDWPKFTEQEPEVYERSAAARICANTSLRVQQTGFRKQEATCRSALAAR
jgi:hypothetical protein